MTLSGDPGEPLLARLAVVADGTGTAVAGIVRERRDYGQVALIAKVWHGPAARGWRLRTLHGQGTDRAPPGRRITTDWCGRCRPRGPRWSWRLRRGCFPGGAGGALRRARDGLHPRGGAADVSARARIRARDRRVAHGRDRQCGAGIASDCGAGFQSRRARRVRTRADNHSRAAGPAGRANRCSRPSRRNGGPTATPASRSRTASRSSSRRTRRVRWPRGIALTLLDVMPPAKKAFTRAMLFGFS